MQASQTKRGTRAVAFLLSALMLCPLIPVNAFAADQAAESDHVIAAFAPLSEPFTQISEGVYVQKVAPGTALETFGLPEQLEVSVTVLQPAVADAAPAVADEPAVTDTDAGSPELIAVTKSETLSVLWESTREYTSDTKGAFVFHPVLPEGYAVADGVKVPRLYVSVTSETCTCTSVCLEGSGNEECADCAGGYENCSYFPESCICTEPCTDDGVNSLCPFCAQGAENCTFTYGLAFGNYPITSSLFSSTGPVVTDKATYDVYIHVDPSWNMDSTALKALVEDKLQTLIDSEASTQDYTYRIHTSAQTIDTTDLRYWYVYDHYDTAVWGNDPATAPSSGGTATRSWSDVYAEYKMYGDSGRQRPFQIVTETASAAGSVLGTTTIDYLLSNGKSLNYANKLTEHIYAGNDPATGSFMTFVGYGNKATPSSISTISKSNDFTDYLFYPSTSLGTKTVEFTVNASEVQPHSLESAGFLCNAGIEEPADKTQVDPQGGDLSGYLVSIGYKGGGSNNPGAGTPADAYQYIRLYKINDNVKSADFSHFANSESGLKIEEYATSVGSAPLPATFNTQSDIRLTIQENSIKMEMRKTGESTYDYTHTWSDLASTGYQGFGPYVAYEDQGHTCPNVSAFRFSNLKMAFAEGIDTSDSLLAPVRSANYLDKGDQRFFVNLVNDDAGTNYANVGSETSKDKAYASLLKSSDIALITNKTSTAPDTIYPEHYLGSNALDIHTDVVRGDPKYQLINDGSDAPAINQRAAEIAWLIYNYERDTTGGTTPSTPDTAIADLWLMDSAPGTTDAPWTGANQVNQIQKELIPSDNLKVYLNPDKSQNAATLTPKYTFKKPDGSTFTPTLLAGDQGRQYFEVDSSWAIGEYTIALDYDLAGQSDIATTLPATAKFSVETDGVAPTVTKPTNLATNTDGQITATIGAVNTPSTGVNTYTSDLADYAVVVSTSATAPGADTIADSAKTAITTEHPMPTAFTNDAVSNTGNYFVHVYVWDAAGNVGVATSDQLTVTKRPQTLTDHTDYSKLPPKTPDGYYVLEYGKDELTLNVSNETVLGDDATAPNPMIDYSFAGGQPTSVVELQNKQYSDGGKTATVTVVPKNLGNTIIEVTAPNNESFNKATSEIKIKVVAPLSVAITSIKYDSTGITVLPSYQLGAFDLAEGATLQYREVGAESFTSVSTWDGTWSNAGYTIAFASLKPGVSYEVKITAQDQRTPNPTKDSASLTFIAPKSGSDGNGAGTGTGVIEGEVTDVPGNQIIITTLKKGDEIIASGNTTSPSDGSTVDFAFSGLPDGKYNVVIADKDGNSRTQEVELSGGKVTFPVPAKITIDYSVLAKKKTDVRFDPNSPVKPPVVIVDQLNEQYDAPRATQNNKGITQADMDIIAATGGSALIELFVTGVVDAASSPFAADIQRIKDLSQQRISQLVDLTLFKTITPDGSMGITTQLLQSNDLLKISVPLENFRGRNTNVYRVHEDGTKVTEKLAASAAEGTEYYEIDGNYLVLHVKKFSLYAVTYTPRSTDPTTDDTTTGNTTTDKTTHPVSPDKGTQGGTVATDKENAKLGDSVTITVKPDNGFMLDGLTVTDKNGNQVTVKDNGDNTFTFTMPDSEVTITPTFRNTLASLEQTGVGKLLNSDDHMLYLIGDTRGQFRPEANMTRAEVAQMFYRLLRDQNITATASFQDVSEGAWYAKPVLAMATLGIIEGNQGNYRPNDPITRAEFTAIAMRFANKNDGTASFSDVASSHWAYSAIGQACSYGWINGMADGTFRPDSFITRTQVARIVNCMLVRIADKSYIEKNLNTLKIFPDAADQSYWGWLEIVEATNGHDFKVADNETWTGLKGA